MKEKLVTNKSFKTSNDVPSQKRKPKMNLKQNYWLIEKVKLIHNQHKICILNWESTENISFQWYLFLYLRKNKVEHFCFTDDWMAEKSYIILLDICAYLDDGFKIKNIF